MFHIPFHSWQFITIITELTVNILFLPFPLFPMYGGYCKGEWYKTSIDYGVFIRSTMYFGCAVALRIGRLLVHEKNVKKSVQEIAIFSVGHLSGTITIILVKRLQLILPNDSVFKFKSVRLTIHWDWSSTIIGLRWVGLSWCHRGSVFVYFIPCHICQIRGGEHWRNLAWGSYDLH